MDRNILRSMLIANANWNGVVSLTSGSSYMLQDWEFIDVSGTYPLIDEAIPINNRCNYCGVKNKTQNVYCVGCGAPL